MPFVALQHLRWGDEHIAPGEVVPEDDTSRNYADMLRIGQIEHLAEAPKPKPHAAPKPKPHTKPKAEPKAETAAA